MSASVLKSPAHIRARIQAAEIAREWDDAALAKALLGHADSIENDGRAYAPQIMREAARRLVDRARTRDIVESLGLDWDSYNKG